MVPPTQSNPVQTTLDDLQTTLSELEELQQKKQSALEQIDSPALLACAEAEGRCVERLRSHAAHESPSSKPSLGDVFRRFEASDDPAIVRRVRDLRRQAARLKRQIAVSWMTTWRINEYVGDMLGMIAQAGRTAQEPHHGLVFDSTA